MGDVRVDRWRQRGLVYLWRYRDRPRNYPGWHLAADSLGNESLRDLVDLMQKSPYATERAVSITPATHAVLAVPNYWRGQAQAAVTWRIKTLTGEEHASEWRIDFEDGQVLHTIGSQNLANVILGLNDIAAGRGDYALPKGRDVTDDQYLWFWWCLNSC